jgi:hypothetical protein
VNTSIHDFVMLNAITETPAARAAIAQANDTLRKVFARPRPGWFSASDANRPR